MLGNARQHFAQTGFEVRAAQLCGTDQTGWCGGAITTGIGAGE
jgi:hypothetical protein